MIFQDLLKTKQAAVLEDLLTRCVARQHTLQVDSLRSLAETAARATSSGQSLPEQLTTISDRWYNSLATGNPDYSVYGEDEYIAELWACWKVYSRTHLLNIQKPTSLFTRSIVDQLEGITKIVDLGCGFAYTTAALKQIFPNASIWGTNLENTLQMTVAKDLATDYGFQVSGDLTGIAGKTDLIFASEYFEHIDRPIEHLNEVIETLQPRFMLIANAFGPIAIGHFREYSVREQDTFRLLEAKKCSKIFNETLRHHGYTKVKTKLWNNRPAYWEKKQ